MQQILERLALANIQLLPLPEIERHFVFEREGYIAIVERTARGEFGKIGAPGLLTPKGMAVLIERDGRSWFVAKGFEQPASPESVGALRAFGRDLESALKG